jgi:phage baseplate assembly protein V
VSPAAIKAAIQRAMAGVRWPFIGVLGTLRLSAPVQRAPLDGLAGEALSPVELWQQFGLVTAPPAGTQAIVVPLGGRSSASVIVATENAAYRLQLNAEGEVALYNQDGDYVWLLRGGHVRIKASTHLQIDAPATTINGNLAVMGNFTASGNITDSFGAGGLSMAGMRTVHNGHVHPESNVNGGSTGTTPQVM